MVKEGSSVNGRVSIHRKRDEEDVQMCRYAWGG